MNTYRAGIDIGSTTVKIALLDEKNNLIYGNYVRHQANTQGALAGLLKDVREKLGDCALQARITGSGAITLAKAMGIGFVQEVVAVAGALKTFYPQTDVARRSARTFRRLTLSSSWAARTRRLSF